jgi:hypothetical protein
MHTIQLEIEDNIYNDMIKRGINLQDELKGIVKKAIYKKEHKIANDIKQGLEDVNKGKTRPIQDLLNEL